MDNKIKIKEGGVYLITGGAGGLGKIFATYISNTKNTHLILTGRSVLSEAQQKIISAIPNATYYRCDVSDKEEVKELIQTIKKNYKKLDGIIHSAGVIRDNFIIKKTTEEIKQVLSSKIQGVKNLDEATKDEALDFIILFSSVAGVMGNMGQADYASANAYLDNYAAYRNELKQKGQRQGKTISINWPLWKDGGMQIDTETEKYLEQQWGILSLPTTEGIHALEQLLNNTANQAIVVYGKEDNFIQKLTTGSPQKQYKPSFSTDTNTLQEKVKTKIVELASKLLNFNVKDIATDEKLGSYGFDSILLTKFSNELNDYYNLNIMPTIFYNYPTIEDVARFLVEDYSENIIKRHDHLLKEAVVETNTAKENIHSDQPIVKKAARFLPNQNQLLLHASDHTQHINESIAIIGISGCFPGSPDLHSFWENLRDNKDLITEIPADRWDWNTTKIKWGGFIADIDKFDPLFFNISPKEAELMDPQQRITLEAVYHALEDACLSKDTIKGSNTGVFIGVSSSDYFMMLDKQVTLTHQAQFTTGSAHSILVNRISYLLDIHGPSEPIDTACSSSLVAIHKAVENIRNGHCDMAIAGGVNALLSPSLTLSFSEAGMLSEDGRCKTFDQSANGYVRGEGVGIIILKPLSKAEQDGDHIYGVIRGTAENHGGKANTLTSPNPQAQKDLLLKAYRSANVDPRDISYIEAHGTGTPLGDPIEIEGLKLAFATLYKERNLPKVEKSYCSISSVKTNIGHLEAAAGIAAVIKVLLSIKHQTLPGNPHLATVNEYIQLNNTPFYLQKETTKWETVNNKPRIAGISSFGFGGANAHIIIEEYQPKYKTPYSSTLPAIIVLSAKNEESLKEQVINLKNYLSIHQLINLHDIAYTLQTGREAMEERFGIVAHNIDELREKLSNYLLKVNTTSSINTKERKEQLNLVKRFLEDNVIENSIEKGKYDQLVDLWCAGLSIDWNLLYPNQKPSKISLPVYPFARERYWIPTAEEQVFNNNNNKSDRLLHSYELDLTEQKDSSAFTIKETFLVNSAAQHYSSTITEEEKTELRTELRKASTAYIKTLIAKELKLSENKLALEAPFEKYGIDSITINKLTHRLEETFGRLPKTLFFEYQNLSELIDYFIEHHADQLQQLTNNTTRNNMRNYDKAVSPVLAKTNAGEQFTKTQINQSYKSHEPSKPFNKHTDIAIIGLSGRYPGAKNVNEFWNNLKQGKDSITEIPKDRWNIENFYDKEKGKPGKSYSKWGGFIEDVDKFDPLFFTISPKEAELMDPQERLFLQTVWEAIEDAGYTRAQLQGENRTSTKTELGGKVGVYAGVMYEEYQLYGAEETLKENPIAIAGSPSSIANRISYYFNFHGPSMAVDTMCSSSLTAIHLACESIQNGNCALAIAGGVNVSIHPNKYLMLSQGKFVSSKGRCESFGEGGEGYVPSEGVGAVLLKPLHKAEADGDQIYGVIKGTSLNHGGKTNGYTVPNPNAQAAVIKEALQKANVQAADISYIEAHGTGTSLGDPIEIAGLTKAFELDKKQYCSIGSVKSNIGHCESAAGISGLTKILLQLKYKQLVPSLHAATLSPNIDFENSPFKVQQVLEEWETESNKPRIAGISSFGAGGSNAHIIIEEYQSKHKTPYNSTSPAIILLSAKNETRLKEQVINLKHHLSTHQHINIYDIAYTLQIGRESMEERLALVVNDKEKLATELKNFLEEKTNNFLSGNIKKDKSDFLLEEEYDSNYIENTIKNAIQNKETTSLIKLWIKGVDIDWNILYPTNKPNKISLPTYPFEKKRYWFDSYLKNTNINLPQLTTKNKFTMQSIWETEQMQQCKNHIVGEEIQIQFLEGGIALVQIQSKATRNMFTPELVKSLQKTFLDLRENKELKVIVLTGYDNIFCMGGSETELSGIADRKIEFSEGAFLYRGLLEFDVPVISAMQGHAFGGGLVFGLYGDIILMSEKATYTANFMKYGFTPGLGATYILGEKLGKPLATEMMFTAKQFSGEEIRKRGASVIVTQEVLKEALQIARDLSSKPRIALELLKQKMSRHILSELSIHIEEELQMHQLTFHTEEVKTRIVNHFSKTSLQEIPIENKVQETPKQNSNNKIFLSTLDNVQSSTEYKPIPATSNIEKNDNTKIVQLQNLSQKIDSSKYTTNYNNQPNTSAIINKLKKIFEDILHVSQMELDEETVFSDFGLDSISGVQIVRSINETFNINLDAVTLYDYHTFHQLAKLIAKESNWLSNQIEQQPEIALVQETEKLTTTIALAQTAVFSTTIEDALSTFSKIESTQNLEKKAHNTFSTQDIAIIGMSGKFPEADSVNQFWENVKTGKDSIKEVPPRKWQIEKYYSQDKNAPGKSYSKWMGYLQDEDKFDASFFNISPREAERMDPQQRLFLEECWKTIEDAGYSINSFSKNKCGVFVGTAQGDYATHFEQTEADTFLFTGSSASILAGRISYYLNLQGPAISIDTACSSSLVAIHQACQSIKTGECEMALAGGIYIMTTEQMHVMSSKATMLSEDGRCYTFDNKANGFVIGEAVGVLLLKPLEKAERDGDKIYGIIKGSSINQDGRTNGLTAPSGESQTRLEKEVYEKANINPSTITYVEAHGTGTKLGDPIEIKALKESFQSYTNKINYCAIGSVKANIGHTLTAAGVSSVIKVLLALKHRQLPPSINYNELNEHIKLNNSPFYINNTLREWTTENNQPRRAAVSSFGFSGTNAHIVIEEYPSTHKQEYTSTLPAIILLSAKNRDRLKEQVINLKNYLFTYQPINLYDIAYTLQVGREPMEERLAIVITDKKELTDKLNNFIENKTAELFIGNIKENKSSNFLLEGGAGKAYIHYAIQHKEIKSLAQLWVTGIEIDWNLLYPENKPHKINLPTYPFEKKRYWFDRIADKQNQLPLLKIQPLSSLSDVSTSAYSEEKKNTIKLATLKNKPTVETKNTIPIAQIETTVSAVLCNLLYLELEELDKNKPFNELGLDSILGVEFIKTLNKDFNINLKASKLYDYPTVKELSAYVLEELKMTSSSDTEEKPFDINTPVPTSNKTIFQPVSIEGDFSTTDEIYFYYNIGIDNNPCLSDHLVFGNPVLPTDAYLELVYTVFKEHFGVHQLTLKNIRINEPLVGKENTNRLTKLALKKMPNGGLRFIISSSVEDNTPAIIHIKGFVEIEKIEDKNASFTTAYQEKVEKVLSITDINASHIKIKGVYADNIKSLSFTENHAIGVIDIATKMHQSYIAQAIDAALACSMSYGPYKLNQDNKTVDQIAYLPYEIKKITIHHSSSPQTYQCVVHPSVISTEKIILNIEIIEEKDKTFVYVEGLELRPVTEQQLVQSLIENKISEKRTSTFSPLDHADVAIIGISCRYPGADSAELFWENLSKGVDSIVEVSQNHWGDYSWYHPDPQHEGTSYTKWAGFVKDTDKFDPLFFGISPREAEFMDPQQRLFLEESWKAIEDAGYNLKNLNRKKVGVFVGAGPGDYLHLLQQQAMDKAGSVFTGSSQAILASRIAYCMNLTGPALAIDTACSSSLVAIDRAYQSILLGECEMALAGGVNLMNTSTGHIWISQVGMPSKDGRCKTFDDSADGIVSGEGIGVVVLKKLKDAERDGDHIYAVIKGSGINQDGKTNGITAPSARSQMELELGIYEKYNIDPSTITYVEAHGTATKLGDPIEIDALTDAFKKYTNTKQYCAIGSAKTNIGHTAYAAGVAAVIKTVLMMKHGKYVPSLHYHKTNTEIDIEHSPFYVNTELKEWKTKNNQARRAAISSFGFSGTNAHLVIEEYQPKHQTLYSSTLPAIIILSAKNEDRLKEQVVNLKDYLSTHPLINLYDIAYTLQIGREAMEERLAIVVNDKEVLITQLHNYIINKTENIFSGNIKKNKADFIFKGEGYIEVAIKNKELASIAQLWVKGSEIDWNLLYPNRKPNKISLPTYPFAKERCWVPIIEKQDQQILASISKLHPLLHSNDSDLNEQKYSSVFTGKESFLIDHQVRKEKVLPGVAYLELAREAGFRSTHQNITQLKDISWLSPIRVHDTALKVQISIYPVDGELVYEVYTEQNNEEQIHSRGKLNTAILTKPEKFNLPAIQSRLNNTKNKEECYQLFKTLGIDYGSSFQGIETLYYSEEEALSKINLPKQKDYILQPGVLDSALQTCIGIGLNKAISGLLLPFSVQEVNIYQTLSEDIWCYVRRTKSNNNVEHYNIDVLNEQGEIVLSLKDFVALPIDPTNNTNPQSYNTSNKKHASALYVPIWERVQTTATLSNYITGKHILVTNNAPIILSKEIKKVLEHLGNEVIETTTLKDLPSEITDIYLLQGLSTIDHSTALVKDIGQRELSVFNAIKTLLASSYREKELNITAFTYNTQKVLSTDQVQVAGSGIVGLIGSLAKEQPLWNIRMIDIESASMQSKDIEKILQASSNKEGLVTAYRNGYHYHKSAYPIALEPRKTSKLKVRGTYVILGGAGGIGKLTTKHLIEKYQAQIIWLGKSALNEKIIQSQNEIEKLGIRPLYISCDANDKLSVEKAYKEIKATHNTIDGLFHSAIVLNDMLIKNMSEEDFKKSFYPKSLATHHFIETFTAEPLDFICFYSSIQSQLNAAGQANYSAGCTYKDSYAQSIRNTLNVPTYIINWGYWGEVGVVSADNYRQRMEWLGIESISPTEGIHVLETVLSNEQDQILVPKLTEKILATMPSIVAGKEIIPIKDTSVLSLQIPDIDFYVVNRQSEKTLKEICSKRLLQTLLQLKIEEKQAGASSMDDLRKALAIETKHSRLFNEIIRYLKEINYITYTNNKLIISENIKQELEYFQLEERLNKLVEENKEYESQSILLKECLQSLQEILTGKKRATDVIFPQGSLDYVSGIYKGNYQSNYFNELLSNIIVQTVSKGVKHLAQGEKIRIVEIGAGTGGTSEIIFKKLTPYKEYIEYLYTDISKSFLLYAEETYKDIAPYLQTAIFNIEQSPNLQSVAIGNYDIVIGANVVHATKNIAATLNNIKSLLKKNGLLILNELAQTKIFTTLTFGLLDGWWLYEDGELRLEGSPGLSAQHWATVLTEVGFNEAQSYPTLSDLPQQIITAISDGRIVVENTVQKVKIEKKLEKNTDAPIPKEALQMNAEDYLKKIFSKVLKIEEHKIDVQAYFETMGIDSIMIGTLSKELSKDFGSIPITTFFEYRNISALSQYLLANHANHFRLKENVTIAPDIKIVDDKIPESVSLTNRRFKHANFLISKSIKQEYKEKNKEEDIAIIGLSGKYPGANNINEFWENLKQGKDSVIEIPKQRWSIEDFYDKEKGKPGKIYSKWGGFIDDVDKFDSLFFNVSPREAQFIDPQERLFLQTVWEAIEDSGYTGIQLQKNTTNNLSGKVGVYAGVMYEEYQLYGVEETLKGNPMALSGSPSSIANRISYIFNFNGPSIVVDTMCSSSLTAIYLACKELQLGGIDVAIAGGVNVSIHPNKYLMLSQNAFLSSRGKCESFGETGEGFIPAEGVGAVVLKPFRQAEKDGDHIYGIIKAAVVNHGGKTNGYSVPDPNAQAAVIKEAIQKADIQATDIGYIEAHGTGTSLGDPIEIAGLTKAFKTDKKQYCAIGSVKSNIGHCESAAGISALTKVLLQLKHRQLVPSLHAATLNPNIDFANSPFKVQQTLEEWKTENNKPRIAGISSFGAGGSNAHIIVQEYQSKHKTPYTSTSPVIILLSAKNENRLKEQVINFKHYLLTHPSINLYDIAYTLQVGREAMEERLAVVIKNTEELMVELTHYLEGKTNQILKGNIKKDKSDFLLEGEAGKGYIDIAIRNKETKSLAQLWVKGINIDWNLLYEEENKPNRISLPTYPFAKERHWLNSTTNYREIWTKQKASFQSIDEEVLLDTKKISLNNNGNSENDTINQKKEKIALSTIDDSIAIAEPLADVNRKINIEKEKTENNNHTHFNQSIDEKIIFHQLKELFKNALYLTENFDEDKPFNELGLDSIIGVELIKSINERFSITLPATKLYEYPTLQSLTSYVIEQLPKKSSTTLKPVPSTVVENSLEGIAIIALGGIFSEADHPDQLWSHVASGKTMENVVKVEGTSFSYGSIKEFYQEAYIQKLKLTKDQYNSMGRQQKLIFNALGQALQENNLLVEDLSSKKTGVFIGAQQIFQQEEALEEASFDNQMSYLIPNNISFLLNLKGPSEVINTYCTSVYVALHRAVQSIQLGECDQAIVGGVNVISPKEFTIIASNRIKELLSNNNSTKSFCDDSSGFVRSEGTGVLIIKSLQQAKQNHNKILALVKSTAVQHGGRGFSLEAPGAIGIKEVIKASVQKSGINTSTIDYVEAHGIANRMADAIELGAISNAYKQLSSDLTKKWYIGSIKPTIGHSELASGMASLIKVIKAFQYKTIPGISGLGNVNTELDPNHAMILQAEASPWKNGTYPRRAALNSYAVGGVNAHIILEEYKEKDEEENGNKKDDYNQQDIIIEYKKNDTGKEAFIPSVEKEYTTILSALTQEIFEIDLNDIDRTLSPIDYGFDSVKIIQLVRRMNETLDLNIKMGQILGVDNFEAFFDMVETSYLHKHNKENKHNKLQQTIHTEKQYPLSEGQQGLWFIQQLEPDSTAYNVPIAFSLPGKMDNNHLQKALKLMLEEYPILGTRFITHNETGEIFQQLHAVDTSILLDHTSLKKQQDIIEVYKQLLHIPFNLEKDCLVRLYTRYDEIKNKTYILFVIHHIVFDGMSSGLLLTSFLEKYQRLSQGESITIQQSDLAYFDFVAWEKLYINSEQGKESLLYWKNKLSGTLPILSLPYDNMLSANKNKNNVEAETIHLSKDESDNLKKTAKKLNVNLSILLLSVFKVLLYKLSGEEDILVLTPTAGRPKKEHEQSIGYYVNMMITRSSISSTKQFNNLVEEIKQEFLSGIDHAAYPFPKILSALNISDTDRKNSAFTISYAYQNIFDSFLKEDNSWKSLEMLAEIFQETEDAYALEVYDLREELRIYLKYNSSLFHTSTIKRHLGYFKKLLSDIVEDSQKAIKDYEIVSAEEKHQLLVTFNNTTAAYPKNKTIINLFEEQVLKTPNNIAIVFEDHQLTYKELHKKSNQLARHIRKQYKTRTKRALNPDTLIALHVDRSIEMIIAILAVLKAGGAYVPIDPYYPKERIDYMLEDTQAEIILSQRALNKNNDTPLPSNKLIYIDLTEALYKAKNISTLPQHNQSTDLAYVMYTSGTTGKPKGVMVEHRSVINEILSQLSTVPLHSSDQSLLTASLTFDTSIECICMSLFSGGALHIINKNSLLDSNYIQQYVESSGITVLNTTPSYLSSLHLNLNTPSLKYIILGGELYQKLHTTAKVYNFYGPTEATIISTGVKMNAETAIQQIGKPINNTKIYILDNNLQLVPIGITGEIYIGGIGITRGYLNNKELTTERFIPNPFMTKADKAKGYMRLYKTGDVARWMPDGSLEYMGRNDDQIKLRGCRVELGEIEHALSQINGIRQNCVIAKERKTENSNTKYLVGYYVLDNSKHKPDEETILEKLSQALPEYMVPAALVRMESLPITTNGKLDKRALPDPTFDSESSYVAPRNEKEAAVCKIWSIALGLDKVSITDDFFKIGGNSILSIQVTHQMSKVLERNIKVVDLFRYKTIAALMHKVMDNESNTSNITLLSSKEDKNKPCIFLVHGVGGNILGYYKVIRQLENHYNIYGIQSRGLDTNQTYFTNYAEMLQAYTEEMSTILKRLETNTYNIIGWSYGVNVALDIITELSNKYQCYQAFLIDGSPVDKKVNKDIQLKLNSTVFADNIRALLLLYKDVFGIEDDISTMAEKDLFIFAHGLFGYPYNEEEDLNTIKRRIAIALHNVRNILNDFRSKKTCYKAEIFHIINATQTNYKYHEWDTILDSPHIEIIDIVGNHWSIINSTELLHYLHEHIIETLPGKPYEIREQDNFKGVFTTQPYQKNEIVLVLKGNVLEYPTRTSIQIGKNKHIEDPVGQFINHSFTPTTKIENGCVVALHDLPMGVEITFDYNVSEDKMATPFICKTTGKWVKGKMFQEQMMNL